MTHKYVGCPDRKQDILDIAVARLGVADKGGVRSVPVVATAELDRIVVFYWNEAASAWQVALDRLHEPPTTAPTDESGIATWRWSDRIALATGSERVFVVYKRLLLSPDGKGIPEDEGGTYLDVLRWDSDVGALIPVAQTADAVPEIPIRSLAHGDPGYHVWAAFDDDRDRVVVLCQAMTKRMTRVPVVETDLAADVLSAVGGPLGPLGGVPQAPPVPPLDAREVADVMVRNALVLERPDLAGDGRAALIDRFVAQPATEPARVGIETQLVPTLMLLAADASAAFEDLDEWTPLLVDIGGYDLDARIEGDLLCCIHRPEFAAYEVADERLTPSLLEDVEIALSTEGVGPSYVALHYREVNLATMAIREHASLDVPGGEHVQLHALNPLSLSVDRLTYGTVRVRPGEVVDGRRLPAHATPDVKSYRKYWIWFDRDLGSWLSLALFPIDGHLAPRNLTRREGFPRALSEVGYSTVRFSTLDPYQPVHLLRLNATEKDRYFELLQQGLREGFGYVARRRYRLVGGHGEWATLVGENVLDINHKQLVDIHGWDGQDLEGPCGGENDQFLDFVFGEDFVVSNVLGGCLAADPREPERLFAYTDLGDGGCRAIVDGRVDGALAPPGAKEFDLESITGTDAALEPVSLPAEEWTHANLPRYQVMPQLHALTDGSGAYETDGGDPGSLISGVQPSLDTILWVVKLWTHGGDDRTAVIDPDCLDVLHANLLVPPDDAVESVDPPIDAPVPPSGIVPHLEFTPKVPWPTGLVSLDASGSQGLLYDITTYEWHAGAQGEMWGNGPTATATFPDGGSWEVSLTLGTLGGLSPPSEVVEVRSDGAPTPPQLIVARELDGGQVTISWLAPESPGSAAVDRYRVQREDASTAVTLEAGDALSLNDDPGQNWCFYRVQARNADGLWSRWSAPTRVRLAGAPPPQWVGFYYDRGRPKLFLDPPTDPLSFYYTIYRREIGTTEEFRPVGHLAGLWPYDSYRDNDADPDRTYVYVAARGPDEGTWSPPLQVSRASAEPASGSIPAGLTAQPGPSAGDVSLAWTEPADSAGAAQRKYRVYRRALDCDEVELTATAPVAAASLHDAPPSADGTTFFYTVRSIDDVGHHEQIAANICVQAFDDPLWSLHNDLQQAPEADPCDPEPPDETVEPDYRLGDLDLDLATHKLAYTHTTGIHDAAARCVTLSAIDRWHPTYRFRGRLADYGFELGFESDDVTVEASGLMGLLSIHRITIAFRYWRSFTLAVLMTETRVRDPLDGGAEYAEPVELVRAAVPGDGYEMLPAALAAKPVTHTHVDVLEANADVELTPAAKGAALVGLLTFLGLANLVVVLTGLLDAVGGPGGIIGWIGANVVIAEVTRRRTLAAIKHAVERRIRDSLEDESFRAKLDDTPLLWYAGEGLAEVIARAALSDESIQPPVPLDGKGRNRFRPQTWQMVAVQDGVCRLWLWV